MSRLGYWTLVFLLGCTSLAWSQDGDDGEDSAESMGSLEAKRTLLDVIDEKKPLEIGVQTRIFRQARDRRDEIEKREDTLRRRYARMSKIIADVEDRYKTLRMVQEEASSLIDSQSEKASDAESDSDKDRDRQAQIIKLSKVFSAMKAKEAAKVIPVMEEGLVVQVLKRIKDKKLAKILGALEPELSATLTMRMTGTKPKKKKPKKKKPKKADDKAEKKPAEPQKKTE